MAAPNDRNVASLLSIGIEFVVNNLSIYNETDLEALEILPVNIKNRMLKKFTFTPYFSRNVIFTKFLKAFVNKDTTQIDLSAMIVTDEMLNILCTCRNLKKLILTSDGSDCMISTEGLINLLSNTQKLETLLIKRSSAVNDDVLKCIAHNCPKLQGMDIADCVNVSDDGLESLSVMKIKWLRISRTQVTDKGIIVLVKGECGKTLAELMIDNCVNVTHLGLNKITQCCLNLTALNFLNCGTDILTTEVLMFKQPLKQLFWQIPF